MKVAEPGCPAWGQFPQRPFLAMWREEGQAGLMGDGTPEVTPGGPGLWLAQLLQLGGSPKRN